VHAVGEVTKKSAPGRILAKLTGDRLKWATLGPVYDSFSFPDGFSIDFPDSPEKFRNNLVEAFPHEATAIEDYIRAVRQVSGAMRPYYLSRIAGPRAGKLLDRVVAREARRVFQQRTADVVSRLTTDPKLRTVLTAQWGYYGSTPSRSSWAMQALTAKHFLWGGYYPVGGSGRIAAELLRTVAEAGGWTRISADVQQIVVEKGRAVGVRMADGEEIRAKQIISAAGVSATVRRLLPPEHANAPWVQAIRSAKAAPAHVCLYLGFEGDIREAGAGAANRWFYSTWDSEDKAWQVRPGSVPHAPVLYCSFPSLKDPTHDPGPKQLHTGEIVTFVPWETFAPWRDGRWRRRGEDYEGFKAQMAEQLKEQLFGHMPGLRDKLRYAELSTPLSTDHFVRPLHGSIYGLEPTPERFDNPYLRPRSPIRGLTFSGSEVSGVGVVGALMGGVLAATAVEPVRAIRWLRTTGS
jgi:all-trans-retinol 13,14-reductase